MKNTKEEEEEQLT